MIGGMRSLLLLLIVLTACDKAEKAPEKQFAPATSGQSGAASGEHPSQPVARAPALVMLGDSLTAGRGLTKEQAMPALIQKLADQAGKTYRVINAGRSGDTAASGASRLSWYLRDEVGIAALVVFLGANDAMRGLEVDQLERNLVKIIEEARAYRADLPIFLVAVRAFPNLGRDYGGAFEAIYPRVAEKAGVTLLPFPLEEVAGVPELNQSDGVHPNPEGAEKMAGALWKSLAPYL
jgi:acyl-CoA thioesterase-1